MTAFSRHPPFHTVVNSLPSVRTEGKGLTTVWKGFKCPPLQIRTSSEAALSQTSTTTSTQPSHHYIVLNSTLTPVVTPAQRSPLQPQLHPIVSHHYAHNIISNHHSPLHLQLRLQLHPIIYFLPLCLQSRPVIIYLYTYYYIQSLFTDMTTVTSNRCLPLLPLSYLHSSFTLTSSYIHSSSTLTPTIPSTHHPLLHP